MEKRRILGIGTVAFALVLSIVAVTVAFAAYNSDLNINGSAVVKNSRWSVIFTNLQTAKFGNEKGLESTAKELTAPSIVGNTKIETYRVQLTYPGDYVTYNFTIQNAGDLPAKIDTGFAMPTPTCTKGAAGVDADATTVCNNLEYTLKYVNDDSTIGADVQAGDTFDAGESKVVQLKIYYNKDVTDEQIPTDNVEIGDLNITIPFVQY